jgi:hypothetical protein
MRYYAHLIVNAEHEVFIATNYWESSWASHLYAPPTCFVIRSLT